MSTTKEQSHSNYSPRSSDFGNIQAGAIIVAAGTSQRMKGINKIFAPILGKPLFFHSLEPFLQCSFIKEIVLVLHSSTIEQGAKLLEAQGLKNIKIVAGGQRRQDSVQEGLKFLARWEWVIIHDGARPCVLAETLNQGIMAAQETGAAIPIIPVTDAVKEINKTGEVLRTADRESLYFVQTPQIFRRALLEEAMRRDHSSVPDEATLVEKLGVAIKTFPGSYTNIKVTTQADLYTAEYILRERRG